MKLIKSFRSVKKRKTTEKTLLAISHVMFRGSSTSVH